jgi:spore coat protein A
VDPTLHWANPPGGPTGRDMRPMFTSTPVAYDGPVPMVTHVHGAHVEDISDGYAEEWWLPAASNIPGGFAITGTWYDFFKPRGETAYGQTWTPGSAVFQYPNNQRASTLWYHDHTLGMTRLNVYAGPAGFWLVRGGPDDTVFDSATGLPAVLPGPAPGKPNNPFGDYYEIPIAIQDRSFDDDGSLFFPDTREFFDGFAGPFIPDTPISPIWNPEFFGNMMVVNGQTWPVLNVEQRRYRFRFLNGCNSRFLILQLATDFTPGDGIDDGDWVQEPGAFWQIGAEGGFLPAPTQLDQLLVGLAERADVIMDFTTYPVGTELYLVNVGPDDPFGGGTPGVQFDPSDPASTGQVMKFVVGPPKSADLSTPPNQLVLPAITPVAPTLTRQVSLNEEMFEDNGFEGPVAALLGTVINLGSSAEGNPLLWMDAITENPALGASETWEIYNFTGDAHPIHVHLVQFQVVGRQPISGVGISVAGQNTPLSWETGFKDTVIAYPDEITTIKATFDMTGLYVWHCHIVDHEDNEMMRPYFVGTDAATKSAYITHATNEGETLF